MATPNRASTPSPAFAPGSTPLPVQYTPFRKEQFQTDEGVAAVNLFLSQLTTSYNALLGQGGPTLLPSGINVQGARVTGLAAPTDPTDAVSQSHASTNFGPAAQKSALDLGGEHMLTGLAFSVSGIAQNTASIQQNTAAITAIQALLAAGVTGTILLAKLTGGGTNGSITVTGGLITGFVNPT